MQRILIVYNPNSSRFIDVEKEVLTPAKSLKGYLVGKYEVEKTNIESNVAKLAKLIQDGDLIISAGGDATGIIASNSLIESGKDATLGVLPYGNFNDLSRTLGCRTLNDILTVHSQTSSRGQKLYPLEIIVDDKFFRYATCYVTIGMTAEAVELFDNPKTRKKLQKGHKSSWRSYFYLMFWYFKNRHKKQFIPEFILNGKETASNVSDYCALSGKSMCRVMKGGDDYLKPKVFRSENCRLTNLWRLTKLMTAAIFFRTPGKPTTGDILEFIKPATVELQAEGEYKVFKDIKKIEIKKGNKFIKVICK